MDTRQRDGGRKGGKARAKKLSAKRRGEIASMGGKATWAKIRQGQLQQAAVAEDSTEKIA